MVCLAPGSQHPHAALSTGPEPWNSELLLPSPDHSWFMLLLGTLQAHQDAEGVAVGDLIVDQALKVDGLQLEVDSDVDQPEGRGLVRGGSSTAPSGPRVPTLLPDADSAAGRGK